VVNPEVPGRIMGNGHTFCQSVICAACASGDLPGAAGSRFGRALLRLVSPYGWGRGA
jgi:hypothetical protein